MTTETTNDDISGLSAGSLAGTAIQWQRTLRAALHTVQTAQAAAERGAAAIFGETVPDYEARQRQLAADRHAAEAEGQRLQRESWEVVKRIRGAASVRGGLGLSEREWRDAAALAGLAESMVAGVSSLEDVAGTLRSAAGSGDKARAAAFLAAAEARLRAEPNGFGAEGLRTLAVQVRSSLRDETFDRVHEEIQDLLIARGELGAAAARQDASEAVARYFTNNGTTATKPVRIPPEHELKRMELEAAPYMGTAAFGRPAGAVTIPDGG